MDEGQPRRLDQLGVKRNRKLIVHPHVQLGKMSYRTSRMHVLPALNTQFRHERGSFEKGGHGGDPDQSL